MTLPSQQDKTKEIIYIVDDQRIGREFLQEVIQQIGPNLDISTFDKPQSALEAIDRQTPDLIITDFNMPTMMGDEFTTRARLLPNCEKIPIIVVTIVEDREICYRALEAGATDFLHRPIDRYECIARCRNLLKLRRQEKHMENRSYFLENSIQQATQEIKDRERETIFRLARAGEFRDEETGNHIFRMAKYTRLIAEGLGLKPETCELIELAAPLHDVGKIGISDNILLKADKLSPAEWSIMQSHTIIGYDILKGSRSSYIVMGAEVARHHHEKWDGSGYPFGLAGEDIPLAARIVAITDVYDALRSDRPYKQSWHREKAIEYIIAQKGKHFDPKCVDAFLSRTDEVYEIEQALSDEI